MPLLHLYAIRCNADTVRGLGKRAGGAEFFAGAADELNPSSRHRQLPH